MGKYSQWIRRKIISLKKFHTNNTMVMVKNKLIINEIKGEQLLQMKKASIIPVYDPYQQEKYLGCQINTTINNEYKFNQIYKTTEEFIVKLKQYNLPTHLIYTMYMIIFLPKIKYILPSSYFSILQTNKLNIIILNGILPLLHINRKFPLKLIFVPKSHWGVGIIDVHNVKGLLQKKLILQEIRTNSSEAKLFTICCEQMQLEYRSENLILELSCPNKCYFTNTCISQWWKFLTHNNLTFQQSTRWNIQLQRENYQFIMDIIYQHFPTNKLRVFNHCRLYMKVDLLSEITKPDGISVKNHIYLNTHPSNSLIQWTYIPHPPKSAWKIWEK